MSDNHPVGVAAASAALLAAAALTFAAQVAVPEAGAEPATPTTNTPAPADSGDYPSDELGYTGTAARCDEDQVLMAYGRTSRAMVVICVSPDGELEYHGVRLSDDTALTAPASKAADGSIIATNDGVTYAVSPEMILVSDGDTVLYRDSWLEFGEPRFTNEPTTSSAAPTSEATPTSTASATTTVSTTTVTVTPRSAGDSAGY